MAQKPEKFDQANEVRKLARERVGPVKPSRVIKGKNQRPKPKHKADASADDEFRWKNLTLQHRGELNRSFQLNRRVFKAYLLKKSLGRLWNYRCRGAILNYLNKWIAQLK